MASPLRPDRRFRPASALALLAAALVWGCAGERALPAPKGVVLLVLDCWRFDHLGLDGARFPATPRIDELGPESVRFRRAYAAASWTRPSLPSLLTGLYPSEHGLVDSFESGTAKIAARVLPPEAETLAELVRPRGYRTGLFADQVQLSKIFQISQGFDEARNRLASSANIRRRFLGWLDQAPEQPYFAYLHMLDLHWPYCPRGTFGVFSADGESRSFCGNWRALGDRLVRGEESLSPTDLAALRARYAEQVLELDYEVGKLFDELRGRGLWDETLLVITSDHGEELFEHGGFRHGHAMWEELVHVPFLWKLPKSWGGERGVALDGLVETRSFVPTVLEAVGATIPARVSAPSLVPWLLGKPPRPSPAARIVAESNGLFTVRAERFKLILDTRQKSRKLFDLVADPGESRDLSASEPERLAELESQFRDWRAALQPLPIPAGTEVDSEAAEELRALGYIQ